MLSLRKPSDTHLQRFLDVQQETGFSYDEVGATAGDVPPGYQSHAVRISLGRGAKAFEAASVALRLWREFDTGWTGMYPRETPLETGQTVAVFARVLGVWSVNACRIIYTVDEPGDDENATSTFGFGYGTLEQHAEAGEERFVVGWDRESDEVFYEVSAFFRPRQFSSKLAWPYLHRKVNQFREDSARAMQRAVDEAG